MKRSSKILSVIGAVAFALVLAACGSQPASSSAPAGTTVNELTKVSGAEVVFNNSSDSTKVKVSVKDGESVSLMGAIDTGKVDVKFYKDGEWQYDDSFEAGSSGFSQSGDPGEYEVEFIPEGASGTLYAFSYPTDKVDIQNMDTDQIISTVSSEIK